MKKKILIVSIFACILLIVPVVIANNQNKNLFNKVTRNPEIKPIDTNKEVISFISGICSDYKIKHYSVVQRHIEIWADYWDTIFKVRGFKYSNNGGIIPYGTISPKHLIAQNFIGSIHRVTLQSCRVIGIAFGDIEWY